jgi:hypothetical protein
MYPKFADIDLSVLFNFNLDATEQAAASTVDKMSFTELKRRFFHLTLINSVGSGLVIGKVIEGKMKFGLVHSLVMVTITIIVFLLFIL